MNATVHILDSVVYDLMGVFPCQSLIRERCVSVERRTSFNMLLNFGLKRRLLAVWNDCSANLTAALQNAHNRSLVLAARASDAPLPLADVHVPGLAADERLIGLNFAGELIGEVVVHCLTNPMQHEPCRLLSDTQRPGNFAGANAIFAIADHPECAHPLIQAERGILEDRSHLQRELLLASLAEPDATSLDKRMLCAVAARASYHPIWPAKIQSVLKAAVCIREVNDCVLKCLRRVHVSRIGQMALCVKYIFTEIRVRSRLFRST